MAQENLALAQGRTAVMREVLDGLSERGKMDVAGEVGALRSNIRNAFHAKTGKALTLTDADAFEILWELLIFLDDPTERGRRHKLGLYAKAARNASVDTEEQDE